MVAYRNRKQEIKSSQGAILTPVTTALFEMETHWVDVPSRIPFLQNTISRVSFSLEVPHVRFNFVGRFFFLSLKPLK